KSHLFPIIMVDEPGGDYWRRWLDFVDSVLVSRQLVSPPDTALFKVTDSVDEAVQEGLAFYRVYHRMRYVGSDLVLRLQKQLGPALLERISKEFADIVQSGSIVQTTALPAEANDPHLADLPRLRFRFDRRSLGRLRMLIDVINREG